MRFCFIYFFVFLFYFLAVRKEVMSMFLGYPSVSGLANSHAVIGDRIAGSKFGQSSFGQNLVGFSGDLRDGLENVAGRVAPAVDKFGMPAVRNSIDLINSIPVKKDQANSKAFDSGNSARTVSVLPVAPQTVDYLNAELAKHYGMNSVTAYQEALSNTSYQRAVKDMKAAGLNPAAIFGAGKGYTAGGVGYAGTVDSVSHGSGFGSGSAGSRNGKLFSEGAYHAISTAIGLTAMFAMKKGPIGYYIGETSAKAVLGALNEIFR